MTPDTLYKATKHERDALESAREAYADALAGQIVRSMQSAGNLAGSLDSAQEKIYFVLMEVMR